MAAVTDVPEVLVIDDHMDTCRALVRLLIISGYSAQCIESGRDALEFLKICKPRLVFLDMMMPGIGGLDVLRSIRENDKFKGVRVIIYSAWSDPAMIREALSLGADSYIVKGKLDFHALEEIIHQHLGN